MRRSGSEELGKGVGSPSHRSKQRPRFTEEELENNSPPRSELPQAHSPGCVRHGVKQGCLGTLHEPEGSGDLHSQIHFLSLSGWLKLAITAMQEAKVGGL